MAMALEVTTYLDETDLAGHLKHQPDEAIEVLAQIANSFDTEADARKWAAKVAEGHSGSVAHGMVMPMLLVLVEALAQAEAG